MIPLMGCLTAQKKAKPTQEHNSQLPEVKLPFIFSIEELNSNPNIAHKPFKSLSNVKIWYMLLEKPKVCDFNIFLKDFFNSRIPQHCNLE